MERPLAMAALALTLVVTGSCQAPTTRSETPEPAAVEPKASFDVSLRPSVPDDVIADALPLARHAGASMVRAFVPFGAFQPRRGEFVWERLDTIVAAAERAELQVLVTIVGSPRWNVNAPAAAFKPPSACRNSTLSRYPPASEQDWAADVGQAVARYRGRVAAWEVWNEPDLGGVLAEGAPCSGEYWCGTPAQYAHLVWATAAAVRVHDPQALVVLGGLAVSSRGNPHFLRDILHDTLHPVASSIDVVNVHFYGLPETVEDFMNGVRAVMTAGGAAHKPIWITETGFASSNPTGPEGQRDYLERVLPKLAQAGAARVFWFQLSDPEPRKPRKGCPGGDRTLPAMGLLTSDLALKPAYHSFRALADSVRRR